MRCLWKEISQCGASERQRNRGPQKGNGKWETHALLQRPHRRCHDSRLFAVRVCSARCVNCSIQTFWHVLVRMRFHFSPSLQWKCVKSAIKAVNRVNCKCEMRFTLQRFGSVRFGLVWFTLVGNLTSVDGSLRPHAVQDSNEFQWSYRSSRRSIVKQFKKVFLLLTKNKSKRNY